MKIYVVSYLNNEVFSPHKAYLSKDDAEYYVNTHWDKRDKVFIIHNIEMEGTTEYEEMDYSEIQVMTNIYYRLESLEMNYNKIEKAMDLYDEKLEELKNQFGKLRVELWKEIEGLDSRISQNCKRCEAENNFKISWQT